MPSTIRFEPSHAGFTALLTSTEWKDAAEQLGAKVAAAAGDGFETETVHLNFGGAPRTAVVVKAATHGAALAQATGRVLSAAVANTRV